MKKYLLIISNVLLGAFVGIGLLIAITLLPIKNNFSLLTVMSGSMEPAVRVGSLIIIRPTNDLKKGDIITFRPKNTQNEKETVTHRIYDVRLTEGGTEIITKGDANKTPDKDIVLPNQVVGKAIFTLPFFGYAFNYIKTGPGLMLLIIIPGTIIIYEEIRKIKEEALKILKRGK